jgi:hypothetical protein
LGGGGEAGAELKSPIAAAWSLGKLEVDEGPRKVSHFFHFLLHVQVTEVLPVDIFFKPQLLKNQLGVGYL